MAMNRMWGAAAAVLSLVGTAGCEVEHLEGPGPERADNAVDVTPIEIGSPDVGFAVDASDGTIDGNVLGVTVVHGGGCGDHSYRMFWDGSVTQPGTGGEPARAQLFIRDDTEDRCDGLMARRARFDLTALRQAFGGEAGRVLLDIERHGSAAPIYEFDTGTSVRTVTRGEPSRASDPFTIDSASLDGTELEVVVSYSGGCELHSFEMFWDGTLFGSDPERADLVLVHDANGDSCESFRFETLRFDVSALGVDIGEPMVLNVQGPNDAIEIRVVE